jgi:parallel beta-helix repeat protein
MARPTHLSVLRAVCAAVAVAAASNGTAQSVRVLNVPRDYASIQAAVDHAEEGDVVQVATGTYNENVLVTKSRLRLYGSSGVILDGTGLSGIGIHVLGTSAGAPVTEVEIANFEVRHFERGIIMQWATNARVYRNAVYENLDNTAPLVLGDAAGIELVASRFSDVSQNIVHHNGVVGIQIRDGSTQNTIRGNQVRANGAQAPGLDGRGIGVTGAATHDNRILENEVLDNYGRGIVIRRPAGTAPITGTLVAQNRVHGNHRSGIAIMFAATGNFVLQNDARWNNLSGLPPCYHCNLVELFTPMPWSNVWERNLGTLNLTDACMP